MIVEPAIARPRIVEHATCLACGCLCDDIGVVVEANHRVVEARNACEVGRQWFLEAHPGEGLPSYTIDGQAVELDRAIDRAAEILRGSRAPVIWGLSQTTVEAVGAALAIADQIGAVVDLAQSARSTARLAIYQQWGQVSASLGEVKDRADLVVFWGVDPRLTHPRHWERYSVEPRGRFITEGRAGRFVVVVDAAPSETSRAADLFIPLDPELHEQALQWLRARVRGISVDLGRSKDLPKDLLEALVGRILASRYGALFTGTSTAEGAGGSRTLEALAKLVRDLNVDGRRSVGLELGEPGNPSGAASVMTWQTGAASAVDYGHGFPRHLPVEATLASRLGSAEVDAVLIVANDPRGFFDPDVLDRLAKLPTIVIAPGATAATGQASSVAFDVGRPGIETGGTVERVDGVMLPLRPAIDRALPDDLAILEAIRRRVDSLSSPGG